MHQLIILNKLMTSLFDLKNQCLDLTGNPQCLSRLCWYWKYSIFMKNKRPLNIFQKYHHHTVTILLHLEKYVLFTPPAKEFLLWVFFSSVSNFCFSWNPLKILCRRAPAQKPILQAAKLLSTSPIKPTHRKFGFVNISIGGSFWICFLETPYFVPAIKHDCKHSMSAFAQIQYLQPLNKSNNYNFWTNSIFTICGQIQ